MPLLVLFVTAVALALVLGLMILWRPAQMTSIAMGSAHGFARGNYIEIAGARYRVRDVTSATTLMVSPW